MLLRKITIGFVIQTYDTEVKRFVEQEFVAGDEVVFEDNNGDSLLQETLPEEFQVDGKQSYLPFDLVQPSDQPNPDLPYE